MSSTSAVGAGAPGGGGGDGGAALSDEELLAVRAGLENINSRLGEISHARINVSHALEMK